MGFESASGPVFQFFLLMVVINVLLAVFNMIPVPFDRLRPYGFVILYALLLTGVFQQFVLPIQEGIIGWLI
jgi:hypothetical protein